MSKLEIFECMHELIENCCQSLSAGERTSSQMSPNMWFPLTEDMSKSLRTRCTLVSGNPAPQSRDLPRTPCYLARCAWRAIKRHKWKKTSHNKIHHWGNTCYDSGAALANGPYVEGEYRGGTALPAPTHGGDGNVWDVRLSPYLGLRGLYTLHVWRSMPGKGRARTNEVEEQGSSFQKVFRKTFWSVWERHASEEPSVPSQTDDL